MSILAASLTCLIPIGFDVLFFRGQIQLTCVMILEIFYPTAPSPLFKDNCILTLFRAVDFKINKDERVFNIVKLLLLLFTSKSITISI